MKAKPLIAILLALGIAAISWQAWLRATFYSNRQGHAARAPYRTTILVTTNEAIVFRHAKGAGVASFDKVGYKDATYRFRVLAPDTKIETADIVNVSHTSIDLGLMGFDTSDPKSHYILAGDVWIAWSYHNPGEAWVTYHRNLTELAVVPAGLFSDVDLLELRDKGVQQAVGVDAVKAAAGLH